MIKKLKTLEQIKSENYCLVDSSYGIEFKIHDFIFDGRITKTMFGFFGKKIDVEKHVPSSKLIDYKWKLLKYDSTTDYWFFKDDWFELDVDLLEDDLFEI